MLRKQLVEVYDWLRTTSLSVAGSRADHKYLAADVPLATFASHSRHLDHLGQLFNKKGMRVLEIGSREVTGASRARKIFAEAEYVGFDYYAGPNVDVVGDAHKISSLVEGKFDLVYSSAVFEHLAMPWIVATEIAKVLNVGGMVFVETHFSFASHERPWHFFQYSDMALRVLFSPALGFDCIEAGASNPIVGRFSKFADRYLRYKRIPGLYCHSEFLGKKVRDVPEFSWSDLNLDAVVAGTHYPPPQETKK